MSNDFLQKYTYSAMRTSLFFPTMRYSIVCLLVSLVFSLSSPISFANDWQWTEPTKGSKNPSTSPQEVLSTSTITANPGIYISEVFANPTGTDSGNEWIELYNASETAFELKELTIRNSKERELVIPNEYTSLAAHSYVQIPLPSSFSLPNTSDTLHLFYQENLWDTFIYTHVKEDFSSARFCSDTWTICTIETAIPTPNTANKQFPLEIDPSRSSGTFTKNFSLTLTPSHPEMKIFYTTDLASTSPEDGIEYSGPITITEPTFLRFVGIVHERSTPISTLHFAPKTDETLVYITEYSKDFVEVYNEGKEVIAQWELPCTATCNAYTIGLGWNYLPRTSTNEQTLYILDGAEGKLLSSYTIPEAQETSMSVLPSDSILKLHTISYVSQIHEELSFSPTYIATPKTENLFLFPYPPEIDSDRDGIPDEEERKLGTDPSNPDTDGDGLPDGFEVKYGLSPTEHSHSEIFHIYQALYRQELGKFLTFHQNDTLVSGYSIPLTEIQAIQISTGETIARTQSDNMGSFSFALPSEATHLIVRDTQGEASKPVPLNINDTLTSQDNNDNEPLPFLLTALPNPTGADSGKNEWIQITNTSSSIQHLHGYTIQHADKQRILPNISLHADESLWIPSSTLGFSLRNTDGSLILQNHHQKVLASLTYLKAEEGNIYTSSSISTTSTQTAMQNSFPVTQSETTITSASGPYQAVTPVIPPVLAELEYWKYTDTKEALLQWWSIIIGITITALYFASKHHIVYAWQHFQEHRIKQLLTPSST